MFGNIFDLGSQLCAKTSKIAVVKPVVFQVCYARILNTAILVWQHPKKLN